MPKNKQKLCKCLCTKNLDNRGSLINNDLDKIVQAKTNVKRVRRFGDILATLSRESKLNMRSQE